MNRNPTQETYRALDEVFGILNRAFFGDQFPRCLITIQRLRGAYGCFASARYVCSDASESTDAIILDARHWGPRRTTQENLSTLAHEMCHLWQHHHGKGGRTRYHNRQFARKMFEIGLVTSDTGEPGGKPTGRRVSHYIKPGSRFEELCERLIGEGFQLPYHEPRRTDFRLERRRQGRVQSKSGYVCPECDPPVHVWGKPGLQIVCGQCASSFCCEAAYAAGEEQ
jgi:hypothetical protein